MLESLNQTLSELFGPVGPLAAVGVLGIILIVLTLPTFLRRRIDPLDRLKRERISGAAASGGKKRALRQADAGAKLDRFANFLEPKDEKEFSATRLKLMRAGYRSKGAVRAFHFLQFSLGLGGLAIGAIYALASAALNSSPSMQNMMLFVLGPGIVGYYLPRYWVQKRVESRQQEITNGFPDALDMMLVCVEAGQSLDQSIVRVAREIKTGYPSLAEEFELVSGELKAGKDRVTVLRDMAERSGVTDVSSFVTVMIQSATFGTSIADALRVYAAEMRDKRVTRAEERANTLPTKLTLGSMLFTVPPLLVILVGPSLYSIYLTLSESGNF